MWRASLRGGGHPVGHLILGGVGAAAGGPPIPSTVSQTLPAGKTTPSKALTWGQHILDPVRARLSRWQKVPVPVP